MTYYRVWQEARLIALPPVIAASPLASRPYDLRHSALSTWLNAGVDPTEVAERAGNSVEVLLTRYAKCLDGRQDVANRRIEELLREYEWKVPHQDRGPGHFVRGLPRFEPYLLRCFEPGAQ